MLPDELFFVHFFLFCNWCFCSLLLLFVLLQESFFFFLGRERCLLVVWFSDLHYYQRLVISFAGCLLQDSSFFLGIRKMDYGGASKQEEGEHACYTLILLQEVKNLVSLCEILGCSAILSAASFFYMDRFWL
jgi:hypothetical protein